MIFQSTRPLRGETLPPWESPNNSVFSIHSPLAGRDQRVVCPSVPFTVFQSTRPLRGETAGCRARLTVFFVFNPLAPCGARPRAPARPCRPTGLFNPLAPCGARPAPWADNIGMADSFQSTRPLRGETLLRLTFGNTINSFQSTRPLRGETIQTLFSGLIIFFSIHSPLAGRDKTAKKKRELLMVFQSTRPLRGETKEV